jgi:hypothetical protein
MKAAIVIGVAALLASSFGAAGFAQDSSRGLVAETVLPPDGNAGQIRLTNKGTAPAIAWMIEIDRQAPGIPDRPRRALTTLVFDSVMDPTVLPLPPGGTRMIPISNPAHAAAPGPGERIEVKAVLFGDGTAGGDAESIEILRSRRTVTAEALEEAHLLLTESRSRNQPLAELRKEIEEKLSPAGPPADRSAVALFLQRRSVFALLADQMKGLPPGSNWDSAGMQEIAGAITANWKRVAGAIDRENRR